ncbi:hypothetical protein RHMOL_Rhmol02G0041800 [Rhododendron molle]|uniref:Uncharacterized protein n=1 Tax=Rhododendron molle TaxID=49168 RepID=A0ACC0PL57_RHOML|nr:hypothetical protein RHMOL_Rhmol02G0041800 [Rhododendron molle]
MAAPTNSGESDMANEDIFLNLSPLHSTRCMSPQRSTLSPPRHFLPSTSSMVVPYQGSTSGTSDVAIEEFDVMIYFNIPSSPAYNPTLSPQRPFLPSSNSVVVYQQSNHSMESLPQNQQQDPCTFLQQLLQLQLLQLQQQWIFLLPKKKKPLLLQLPRPLRMLQLDLKLQELKLETLLVAMQHIFLLPKQEHEPQLKQRMLSLLNLQLELQRIFSWLKQMKPPLEQMLLSLNNPSNLSEATVDDEIGIGGVGTWDGEMEKVQTPGGERENKRTTGVPIAIPLEGISQTKGVCIKDAAMNLNASQSTQLNSDTVPFDQALAATIDTNNAVVKETVPPVFLPTTQQLNLDEDFGNGVEAVGMGSERTEESETEEEFNTVSRSTNGQLNSRNLGKRKREKMTPRGARRNKKTNGVRIAIPLEDILQIEEMPLKDAAKHLKVSISELRSSYREYGIPKWPPRNEHKLIKQSLPNETPSVVDQEGFPQLTSHNGPSNQALTATIDTNIDKEIPLPQLLPTTQQENPDAGFGNDAVEAIGMGSEKIREGVMEEGQLNFGCSGKKGKRKVNAAGVKIEITKEDILKVKEMRLNDAAENLEVSRSTLKRACRENGIKRWPPRKGHELIGQTRPNESRAVEHELINQTRPNESLVVEHELISQTCPNESPAVEHKLISQTRPNKSPTIEHELISQTHLNESLVVEVEQEQTPQLNPDTFLSSNQVSTTIDTKSVKLKARYEGSTITFRLSQPLRKVELEQEVKKRLPLEAETYNISYKDEDDDLVLIACDDDLEECISSSTPPGSRCHELFLMRK